MQQIAMMLGLWLALLANLDQLAAQGQSDSSMPGAASRPSSSEMPSVIIPSRPPPARAADDEEEKDGTRNTPPQGEGCRYIERKLELLV